MLFAGIGVVLDGPLILFFEGRTPHFRAWVTFGRSPKSDQKRCLKPQVSRLPARLGYVKNLSPRTPRKPKCCTSSYNESLAEPFCTAAAIRQKEIQKPLVFGGVLFHISFAVERNMATGGKCRTRVQPAIGERKTGRRGRRPLRRDRRECASIRRCADAGRRGRRPLRTHPSGCSGKRGAGDFRAYGGQARA